jgi:hypothetical protein
MDVDDCRLPERAGGMDHSLAEAYLQWNMVPPQDLQV